MSDLTIKVCDVCDRQKGQTNHWFVLFINAEFRAYTVYPLDQLPNDLGATKSKDLISNWDKKDICSIECLNKAENRVREGEKLR